MARQRGSLLAFGVTKRRGIDLGWRNRCSRVVNGRHGGVFYSSVGFADRSLSAILSQGKANVRLWRNLAKHKRVRAISITLDLGGQKSPIRKFNLTATNSETQGAEGGRGVLRGEMAQ